MKADKEGFLQPLVDETKCVHCGKCEKSCPVINPNGLKRQPTAVYAAKANDDELRRGSASGGIFTLLARESLKRGGVVFGAGFEHSTWRVIHKSAETEAELDDLRGSKYVQSDTGDTFKRVKDYLEDGREVVYSGCPCQIAALRRYLNKGYPNLLTVDLICHGVPSPLVWRKYLDCRESEAGSRIYAILPRRYCNWEDFAISLQFQNPDAKPYWASNRDDKYMTGYLNYWFLRPTCYRCAFRGERRIADITLGDYMLIDKRIKGFADASGVSMVFINTPKGECAANKLKDAWTSAEIPMSFAKRDNFPVYANPKKSRLRRHFFEMLAESSYDECYAKLIKRRQGNLLMHSLWWVKRFVINREINRFLFN